MQIFRIGRRGLSVIVVILSLVILLIYVILHSAPFAPVNVTVREVQAKSIQPSLFGIATVEARHSFKVGPTVAGRLKDLKVDVGDLVHRGQLLGKMDPVDYEERMLAQQAIIQRTLSQEHDAVVRLNFAGRQSQRYQQLAKVNAASQELLAIKQQELDTASAALGVVQQELRKARADLDMLRAQRQNLNLVSTTEGIVTARYADPGSTIVAGQTVLEIVDPKSIWINTRFDQTNASGLVAGLPAKIVLRSRQTTPLSGQVLWIEPRADAVTEEILAKVVFRQLPETLPPLGELAEVTVRLPFLPRAIVVPNAAIHRVNQQIGVWKVQNNKPEFVVVKLGQSNLEGEIQVLDGLAEKDQIVIYSEKSLTENSRLRIVKQLAGKAQHD